MMRISKLGFLILQNGVRRKQLSDLTFSGLVSESHCVLCWMDEMLASCPLGSASLAQGKSLVDPVQPQDQSFGAHGREGLGVSGLSIS